MKKLAVLAVCAATLVSCGMGGGKDKVQMQNDSLRVELSARDAELEEMMATFNEISEGFRQINEAENRVTLQRDAVGEGSMTAREQMASDIEFIRKQMDSNKKKIAKLQQMLKKSNNQSAELKKALDAMTKELAEKQQRIEDLQSELASKNIRIQELDAAVSDLSDQKTRLEAENEAKAATVAQQDKALHTAWFVFGTKKELKDQKILTNTGLFKKGQVMEDKGMNKDYFTEIDIRTTKDIKLYSKSADVLTSHPEGSYRLDKDEEGMITFRITDPAKFWGASKYLVIQVK